MPTNNTAALEHLLTQIEAAIPDYKKINPAISSSNIGWHINHALLVLIGIIDTTSKSNPKDYSWSFNYRRLVIFTKNKIPRGVAKAPNSVIPKDDCTKESLSELLIKANNKLAEIHQMDSKLFFKHPGLGNMKLKQTLQFLAIHTKHHLEIIEDIKREERKVKSEE